MQKKTIAVDVDDVLSATAQAFVEFSNIRWGTSLTVADIQEDWSSMWQIDVDELRVRADEFFQSGLISSYKRYDEALPVLEYLHENYRLIVLTSRSGSINAETIAWINYHYPGIFDEIHFSGFYDNETDDKTVYELTKADKLVALGASYLIDDQPKHCNGAAEAGLEAVLFGEYPWNVDAIVAGGVTRCTDWLQVREFFDAIER